MATPFPADDPYLTGGFEPIRFECEYDDLVVEGEIPGDLSGCLYRIGPNPQFAPRGPYNPLAGDGMIHAFNIHRGRVSYRNRWVRTQQWRQERTAGRALFDSRAPGAKTDGVANTSLLWHAGRLLALEEGHAPIGIDPVTLETLGVWDFAASNLTAHPKVDPESGEAVWFANFPNRDFTGVIDICVVDAAGTLVRCERIAGPYPALVHDFAVTREFVIFFLSPLTVSIERARAGGPAVAWEPERGSWLGIVPRAGGPSQPQWIAMPASMVWHAMNAFNDDHAIYIDVCQQAAAAFPSVSGKAPPPGELQQYLTRWRIDWPGGRHVVSEQLSEVVCEYPRIDERLCGRDYRYGYMACHGGPGTGDLFHRAIGRFDHTTRRMQVYRPNGPDAVSEPVFVPRSPHCAEADGYLLTVNFDERRKASYLAIFEAQALERGPVARALLDHRVPMGFHGTWLPR